MTDGPRVGEIAGAGKDLAVRGWVVDPAAGFEGAAEVVVRDGVVVSVTALDGEAAAGLRPEGILIAPGFVDLRAHLREPGDEDAETIASGLAAAAHGGFTAVCIAADTDPAAGEPGVVGRIRAAVAASGSPVRALVLGAVTHERDGATLAALGELADAGVVAFSDDPRAISSTAILRNALLYAGALGIPVMIAADDAALTAGAEANEGYVATVIGLRGAPAAAESGAVAAAIDILAGVVRDEPRARLHLGHLSTAASLAHVRAARAAGLPVTCDVAPHHLALSDEWLAGARRWAWEALDADGGARDPWADGALEALPFDPALRVTPPLRGPLDAAACARAVADGTVTAIATDHAPRHEVETHVEFGEAPGGIAGLETAAAVVLAAVDAGQLTLGRAIEALTTGPALVLGERHIPVPGLRPGQPADLVVIDRGATWTVTRDGLASRGWNQPLLGRELRGVVRLTVAGGRIAYSA